MLQRAKPGFDNEVAAILTRLRRSRIVGSDETSVRIDGRTHWNWVFQNEQGGSTLCATAAGIR
jgi:transposase